MSKNSKKKFVLLLFFLMVVTLIPAIGLPVGATAKPKLTKKLASIVIGETSKIKIKNIPKGAKITYKSSKKSIATVSKKGKVKGVKSGNAKITISIKKNSKVAKLFYKVTVQRPKLSKRILSLVIGETTKLYIENKPKLAKYIWTSNNTEIATVDEKGIVMAKSNGVATIKSEIKTAKATYYLQCRIIITKPRHTLQKYVVTFNSNGGSAVSSQTVMENSKAMKPARPSRSGYVFDGWYTDINGGTLFDFSTRIKGNITLYAYWNKIYNEMAEQLRKNIIGSWGALGSIVPEYNFIDSEHCSGEMPWQSNGSYSISDDKTLTIYWETDIEEEALKAENYIWSTESWDDFYSHHEYGTNFWCLTDDGVLMLNGKEKYRERTDNLNYNTNGNLMDRITGIWISDRGSKEYQINSDGTWIENTVVISFGTVISRTQLDNGKVEIIDDTTAKLWQEVKSPSQIPGASELVYDSKNDQLFIGGTNNIYSRAEYK